MPRGYSSLTGEPTGAPRRYFVGMQRVCKKCGVMYVVTEAMVRNRSYACRACASRASVERAKRNRERKRASNNAWHAKNSANRADATRSYRKRHPEANAAHQAVATAIRNGTLSRQPCSVCGAGRAHAHHDDYSKPLSVIWLCHRHHMERHAMLAARERT